MPALVRKKEYGKGIWLSLNDSNESAGIKKTAVDLSAVFLVFSQGDMKHKTPRCGVLECK